jgi:hypothetical protein
MNHTYTVSAELESELYIYTTALARYCANCDFESELRNIWKHEDLSGVSGEEVVERIWDMWHELKIQEVD